MLGLEGWWWWEGAQVTRRNWGLGGQNTRLSSVSPIPNSVSQRCTPVHLVHTKQSY